MQVYLCVNSYYFNIFITKNNKFYKLSKFNYIMQIYDQNRYNSIYADMENKITENKNYAYSLNPDYAASINAPVIEVKEFEIPLICYICLFMFLIFILLIIS